mmetsp:Transcript_3148/g.4445  ORF Transcript_3148/g.4445 Transcript_3148/m.4445 type:complete len:100 (+) Transcript_3148:2511-2810(+)
MGLLYCLSLCINFLHAATAAVSTANGSQYMCYFDIQHPYILCFVFVAYDTIDRYPEIRNYSLICCFSSFDISRMYVSTEIIFLMFAALPSNSSRKQSCN